LKKKILTLLTIASAAVLTACGGGGSTGADSANITYSMTQSGTVNALAGSSVTVTGNASARAVTAGTAGSIKSMAWTMTTLTGSGSVTPVISDSACAGMNKSGNNASCTVQVGLPDTIQNGTWNILGSATASDGSTASSSFVVQVGGIIPQNDITSLSVNNNTTVAGAVNSTISLPASYTFTSGLTVPSTNISFTWSQTSGSAVTFAGQNTSTLSFIPTSTGTYGFKVRLSALINGVTQVKDAYVSVLVSNQDFFNLSAGSIQTTNLNSAVNLAATLSNPSSNLGNVSYVWKQLTGPVTVTLNNSSNPTANFLPTVTGTYTFQVTATTNTYSTTAQTTVVVLSTDNNAFTVNAGTAQVVNSINSVVNLTGTLSGNAGALAQTATYAWTQTSGPTTTISNPTSLNASFVPTAAGTYVFQLSGTIGGVTQTSSTQVTVLGAIDPSYFYVSAGNSQSVSPSSGTYPAVNLTGVVNGGTGITGYTQTYAWTQTSGPTVTLSNPSTLVASFVPTGPGTYYFQLSVTINSVTKTSSTSVVAY
jgi:chitinase